MKNRTFLSMLLFIALALPGFAQQPDSNSNAQPAATASASQSASEREPLPPSTPKDFWDGDDPNFVNLVTHPFASKKYVQRQVGPIRDRINELDELTSENSKTIKDVDGRAQQGIQLASEKSSLADQHATDASNKAQLAQTAATQVATRVSTAEQMVGSLDQYKGSGQTEIRFRAGWTVLSKAAKDALDEMAAPLKDQRSYIIEVRGFSPGRGQTAIASPQEDSGLGSALPGAQPPDPGLPHLRDEHGQLAGGWRRWNNGEAHHRRAGGSQPDEERSGGFSAALKVLQEREGESMATLPFSFSHSGFAGRGSQTFVGRRFSWRRIDEDGLHCRICPRSSWLGWTYRIIALG